MFCKFQQVNKCMIKIHSTEGFVFLFASHFHGETDGMSIITCPSFYVPRILSNTCSRRVWGVVTSMNTCMLRHPCVHGMTDSLEEVFPLKSQIIFIIIDSSALNIF